MKGKTGQGSGVRTINCMREGIRVLGASNDEVYTRAMGGVLRGVV
jgi:hypothetical protein